MRTPDWFSVKVFSQTSQPAYNVLVTIEFKQKTLRFYCRRPLVGPTDKPVDFESERGAFHVRLERAVTALRELRMGSPAGEAANALADTNLDLDYWHAIDQSTIVVEFNDGNNVRWQRHIPGELVKL